MTRVLAARRGSAAAVLVLAWRRRGRRVRPAAAATSSNPPNELGSLSGRRPDSADRLGVRSPSRSSSRTRTAARSPAYLAGVGVRASAPPASGASGIFAGSRLQHGDRRHERAGDGDRADASPRTTRPASTRCTSAPDYGTVNFYLTNTDRAASPASISATGGGEQAATVERPVRATAAGAVVDSGGKPGAGRDGHLRARAAGPTGAGASFLAAAGRRRVDHRLERGVDLAAPARERATRAASA